MATNCVNINKLWVNTYSIPSHNYGYIVNVYYFTREGEVIETVNFLHVKQQCRMSALSSTDTKYVINAT